MRLQTAVPSQLCGFQVVATRLAACLHTGLSNAAFRIAYLPVFVCACTKISFLQKNDEQNHRHRRVVVMIINKDLKPS
jgi:hypothetical protein